MSAGPNLGMNLGGFDAAFYAANNPDVVQNNIDPATHYQLFGSKEGRAANAAEAANGAWTYAGRQAQSTPGPDGSTPKSPAEVKNDKRVSDFSNNPYGFDAAYYLEKNPSVAAAGVDPLQNFLQYGINNGANRNAYMAANGGENSNIAAGVMAPPPAPAPALDPNDPASWAAFKSAASAATQGINRLPGMAPGTETLSRDPLAVRAQFYPKGNNADYKTLGYGNAGAGQSQIDPQMQQVLRNLGMGV